jgi:hypothetical protein
LCLSNGTVLCTGIGTGDYLVLGEVHIVEVRVLHGLGLVYQSINYTNMIVPLLYGTLKFTGNMQQLVTQQQQFLLLFQIVDL